MTDLSEFINLMKAYTEENQLNETSIIIKRKDDKETGVSIYDVELKSKLTQ